jgi:hypothetical protein
LPGQFFLPVWLAGILRRDHYKLGFFFSFQIQFQFISYLFFVGSGKFPVFLFWQYGYFWKYYQNFQCTKDDKVRWFLMISQMILPPIYNIV